MRTRVKVCCISSLSEAETAVALGADALGLVGDMPSGQWGDLKISLKIKVEDPSQLTAGYVLRPKLEGGGIES